MPSPSFPFGSVGGFAYPNLGRLLGWPSAGSTGSVGGFAYPDLGTPSAGCAPNIRSTKFKKTKPSQTQNRRADQRLRQTRPIRRHYGILAFAEGDQFARYILPPGNHPVRRIPRPMGNPQTYRVLRPKDTLPYIESVWSPAQVGPQCGCLHSAGYTREAIAQTKNQPQSRPIQRKHWETAVSGGYPIYTIILPTGPPPAQAHIESVGLRAHSTAPRRRCTFRMVLRVVAEGRTVQRIPRLSGAIPLFEAATPVRMMIIR